MSILRRSAALTAAVAAALAVLTGVGTAAPAADPVDAKTDCWQRHNYLTWGNPSPTYRKPGDKKAVGKLNKGQNYFYHQHNFPKAKVVIGKYENTWWALTDDDTGNTKVWVNVVYITEGQNNQPVPRLPKC